LDQLWQIASVIAARYYCSDWGNSGRDADIAKPMPMTDTVEKVLSEPLECNNRIQTASCLNRNCVRGAYFESMLRVRAHKIVFQQHRPNCDISMLLSVPITLAQTQAPN
jgi:hypothetical protein